MVYLGSLMKYRTKEEAHAEAIARGADCERCPLYGCQRGPVMPELRPRPRMLIIGEAPGVNEVDQGRPFVGESGLILEESLGSGGLDRSDCGITNAILCLVGATRVLLADGRRLPIRRIVEERITAPVLSVADDNTIVARPITGWHASPRAGRHIVRLAHALSKGNPRGATGVSMTADHPVLTPHGYRAAGQIVDGQLIATGLRRPSGRGLQAFLGTVIGDGGLSRNLTVLQLRSARTSIDLRAALLRTSLNAKVADAKTRPDCVMLRTASSQWIAGVRAAVYRPGRLKQWPGALQENELSALALACIYMDDGGLVSRSNRQSYAEVALCDFDEEAATWIGGQFRKVCGELTVERRGSAGWRLRFSVAATEKLCQAISLYVPPDMAHKLVESARGHFDFSAWQSDSSDEIVWAPARVLTPSELDRNCKTVYCIDVEETHNFLTAAAVVHNCQPPPGISLDEFLRETKRKGLNSPVACCAPRLHRDIAEADAPTMLAVGGEALRSIGKTYGITPGEEPPPGKPVIETIMNQAGAPVKLPDGKILATALHPAFAMRENRQFAALIAKQLTRAANIARRGIAWTEPQFEYIGHPMWSSQDHAIERIEAITALFLSRPAAVACDIETDSIKTYLARIRCFGFCQNDNVMTVPLLRKQAFDAPYWSNPQNEARARRCIEQILEHCSLVFHNGLFDTRVALRRGFMRDRNKRWVDTLLLHRATDATDLPHSLSFVARQETEAPIWKTSIDHKSGPSSASDLEYHRYNCRDALLTDRVALPLIERVIACGSMEVAELDQQLAIVAREMGEIGLFIDESARGALSGAFNALVYKMRNELKEMVGYDLNPGSTKQMREWLFDKCGLTPTLATDGYDWAEGDDAATSVPALIQILDRGVDPAIEPAINKVIEYRACNKLRGSYIDNLHVEYDWGQFFDAPRDSSSLAKAPAVVFNGDEILPERPTTSWMPTTWSMHSIPSGRWTCDPSCFDDITEILTTRGWIRFAELRDTDRVAQFDASSEAVDFVKPLRFIKKRFRGDLITVRSRDTDLAMTPDHRMTVRRKRRGGRKDQLTVRADELRAHDIIPHAGVAGGSIHIDQDTLTLICAAQADGWHRPDGRWEFSFTKRRKVNRLARALKRLRIEYTTRPKQNGVYKQTRFVVDLPFMPRWLELQQPDVKRFGLWMLRLDGDTRMRMREEVMHWDGCVTRMSHYSSSDKWNADLVQTLFTLSGQRAKVRSYENARTTRPNWQVDRGNANWSSFGKSAIGKMPYDGTVYCVTVPKDMIVVRRNGRVSVCNNCQNWPSRGWYVNGKPTNMRTMIVAPPGHVIVGADLEQVEARIAAVVANIVRDIDAFKNNEELHCLTAAMIMADDESDIQLMYERFREFHEKGDKEQKAKMKFIRTVAKRVRYLKCYGGEGDKLFSAMSAERDKATGVRVFPKLDPKLVAEWERRWDARSPEVKQWHRRVARDVRIRGFVSSIYGAKRKRWFLGGPNKKNAPPNHEIQGCLQKHTRVLTRHGLLPIAEAPARGEVWTGTSWATYERLNRGPCELATIELHNGTVIDCDTRHEVLVESDDAYRFKKFSDLTLIDKVCLSLAEPLEFGAKKVSAEAAYWLGYATGNGSSQHTRNDIFITIGNRKGRYQKEEQTARWRAYVESLGISVQKSRVYENHLTTGATIRNFWEPLGYRWGVLAREKRVPEVIWSCDLATRKSFLLGLLDADGTVGGGPLKEALRVSTPNLHMCQREILEEIQVLLRSVGVESAIYGPYAEAWRLDIHGGQLALALGFGAERKVVKHIRQDAPSFAVETFLRAIGGARPARHLTESQKAILHRLRTGGTTTVYTLKLLYALFGLKAPPLYATQTISALRRHGVAEDTYTLRLSDPLHRFDAHGVIHKNTSGDIKNEMILRIAEAIPFRSWSKYTGLCMDIHDYLAVFVPEDRADEAIAIINKCMRTTIKTADGWDMPIYGEAKASRSLADNA